MSFNMFEKYFYIFYVRCIGNASYIAIYAYMHYNVYTKIRYEYI